MTRLPTDLAVTHLVDSLRALALPRAAGHPKRIDDLETRLKAAIQRDRTGTVVPDGYPTSTGSPGGNGGTTESSTERAACALLERPPRDHHHELTMLAVEQLDTAVVALNRIFAALNSIDDHIGVTTPAPVQRTCSHCTGKRGKNNRVVYATGTVGDRLERSIALCKACYGFVERTAKAGTRDGQLPTDQQIRDHEDRGSWRLRVRVER